MARDFHDFILGFHFHYVLFSTQIVCNVFIVIKVGFRSVISHLNGIQRCSIIHN